MEIHLGEFLNLMHNSPVFAGDTLSHQTMKNLVDNGLATTSEDGYIPTEKAKEILNSISCKKITVEKSYSFDFKTNKINS